MTSNPPGATEVIKPGIYTDVPYEVYSSWPAINHSRLRRMRDTPAHMRFAMLNERAPTKALDFGWMIHIAILEPERLAEEVMEVPKVDRRTKEGKLQWAAFERKAMGRMLVDSEQMKKLKAIAENVRRHPTARELLLGPGQNEVSIVWRDEETGVLCKGRIDRIAALRHRNDLRVAEAVAAGTELGVVVDVKTIGEVASTRNFEKAAHNYGYMEQGAMYRDGLQAIAAASSERPFVWLVAETEPPHAVRIFQPDDLGLQWGQMEYRKHLALYKKCSESGIWPAWEDGIETCSIPAWVNKVFEAQL